MLMKSGAMIDNKRMTEDDSENFQIQLMKLQISLEDTIKNLAVISGVPSVIFCDRGLMDTVGYIGWDSWKRILKKTGFTNIELRDHRYDAVIHMVSAADGCPEYYEQDNVARYESVEEAVIRDRELRKAYVGHNRLFFIGNQHKNGFHGKITETIRAVSSVLGLPTNIAKFKKYLVETRHIDFRPSEDDNADFDLTETQKRFEDYHGRVLNSQDISPFNGKGLDQFEYVSNLIRHTYLMAPKDNIIYIRKRSGMISSKEPDGSWSSHFDYERRIMSGEQRIHKKRIMTGREYEGLIRTQRDMSKRTLKILRTSFMYAKQYF